MPRRKKTKEEEVYWVLEPFKKDLDAVTASNKTLKKSLLDRAAENAYQNRDPLLASALYDVIEAGEHENTDYMAAQFLRQVGEQAYELNAMFGRLLDSGVLRLPDWAESKLSSVADDLSEVYNYMKDELRTASEDEDEGRKVPDQYLDHPEMDQEEAEEREAEIRERAKLPSDDPKAYAPFESNIDPDTGEPYKSKPSKHTKKYQEMFGDKKAKGNVDKSLKNKSSESGIPVKFLRQVYDKGLAAWRTGHRPGVPQHAWAMARVNSFITKGKGTFYGADRHIAEEAGLLKPKKDDKKKD